MLNPVIVAVIVLCVLCLLKLNVLLSMLVALFAGGLVGGLGLSGTIGALLDGFGSNGETALAYVLLGTFATALAHTGLADILAKKISKIVSGKAMVLCFVLAAVACCSQNAVPVHIAFIPILIPPLLVVMNKLKLDRRAVACSLAFGLKAPYIAIPLGFGAIFQDIIAKNLSLNGMEVTMRQVTSVNWIIAVAMFGGLMIAIFISYRKPREYKDLPIEGAVEVEDTKLTKDHWVTIVAIIVMVAIQIIFNRLDLSGSLPVAALAAILIMIIFGAIKWNEVDDQFAGGIKLMGFIAFVMLVAGGFATVLKATGAVDSLVASSISLMGGSKLVAALVITLIGLLVTMGIGTSFGTVPVLAVLYVPLCSKMGFSPAATILLMSAAAALGDAGSPASDTTLGPTCGLNADGQHDHIWDTCVPTFLHFNIPIIIVTVIAAQFL